MTKITHISADEGKLKLWHINKIATISSDPKIIAKALNRYGYEERLSFSSSFDFGEESGFKTDDEPSNILDKAFEIVIGKGE
jgi:hypothetical protein